MLLNSNYNMLTISFDESSLRGDECNCIDMIPGYLFAYVELSRPVITH